MSKIKVNTRDIKRLQQSLELLRDKEVDRLMRASVRALAAEFIRSVKKRTPVGKHPPNSGKRGGTLRRGWNLRNLHKTEDGYEIEIYNDIEYASFVEHGHMTRSSPDGPPPRWVEGRHMLKNTGTEITFRVEEILEKELLKFLDKLKLG